MKEFPLILFLGLTLAASGAAPLAVKISDTGGQPQFSVNGQPQVPMSFFGWALDQPQRAATDANWRHASLRFVSPENSTNGGFIILFNRLDEGIPGSVWLDDVRFYTGDADNSSGSNKIEDGDFEQSGGQLPAGVALSFGKNAGVEASWRFDEKNAASGSRSLRVDIRQNPPPGWLGVEAKGIAVRKEQVVTVDFQVKSTMPGYLDVMLLKNGRRSDDTMQPDESLYARQVHMAAGHGIHQHQFSFPVPAVGDADEAAMYTALDRAMAATLREDPQAMVTIRLGVDLGGSWRQPFPDDRETMSDGSKEFPSPSSDRWRNAVTPALEKAVCRIEDKWGGCVDIYMLSGKNTGEWFYPVWDPSLLPGFAPVTRDHFRLWLQRKYQTPAALSAAWDKTVESFDQVEVPAVAARQTGSLGEFFDPLKDAAQIDFFDFYNDEMADAISLLAGATKKACAGRKPVMVFYGYLHALSGSRAGVAHSGHLKWSRLLRDPNIDIFCAPNAYGNREPGGPGTFHGPVDALAPYGKFWFCEDDTLTLGAPFSPNPKFRCRTDEQVKDVERRNFAQDFPRGFGCWYMDLCNAGWLLNDALWQNIGTMAQFWSRHLTDSKPYHPEIVFLADEVSPLYLRSNTPLNKLLLDEMQRPVSQIGAPVGWSLLSAFLDEKVPPARLYLFPNAFALTAAQREKVKEILRRQNATAVWFYAPGYIDPETKTADVKAMRDLTGMNIQPLEQAGGNMLRLTAGTPCEWDDPAMKGKNNVLTRWQVKPSSGVKTLAVYGSGRGELGAAEVQQDGWRSVYIASPGAPAELLRRIAREAGVWLYCENGDVVMGGDDFIGIHAASDGKKTLKMPHSVEAKDIMTGQSSGEGDRFGFPMKLGETRLFWFGKE
ncbi:MAG: beta-galactosidase [Kiritimatiellales bacterium]|jgi:hypothetical protein